MLLLLRPAVELRANLKSVSLKCHLFEVAFVWELIEETIHLPLGCLQGVVLNPSRKLVKLSNLLLPTQMAVPNVYTQSGIHMIRISGVGYPLISQGVEFDPPQIPNYIQNITPLSKIRPKFM